MRTSHLPALLAGTAGLALAVTPAVDAMADDPATLPLPATAERPPHAAPLEGRIPLVFEENRGQAPAGWDFLVRCQGYHAYLRSGEVVFDFGRAPLRMSLEGAREVEPSTRGLEMSGRANYLIGNDASKWITDVPLTRGASYRGVAPGTTWRFGAQGRRLEFTLTVPGTAEPAFRFEGAREMSVAKDGSLVAEMPSGTASFTAPVAWQLDDSGAPRPVTARFDLGLRGDDGVQPVRIALGPRDAARRTFIDPSVSWASYLGSPASDTVMGVATDASGAAYCCGTTPSAAFPTTAGAYDTTQNNTSSGDAFVAKLAAGGASLAYATFLGTTNDEWAKHIGADSNGTVVVSGLTYASDFPVTSGVFQPTDPGAGGHTYITRLNAAGSGLVWSSYTSLTTANHLALAPNGDAVLIDDGSAYRIAANGASLVWTKRVTPLGYSVYSSLTTAYVDAADATWIAATSGTPIIATTSGAYRTTSPGGKDASLTKLSSAGAVVWSTLFGGAANETGVAVGTDLAGRPTLVGTTNSSGMPVTTGAYQSSLNGTSDVFIARFSADGTTLRHATFFGNSGSAEVPARAWVHPNGTLYLAGRVDPSGVPVSNAFQATHGGATDAFLVKLTPKHALAWSSYYGGASDDYLYDAAFGSTGTIVVTLSTPGAGLATAGAFQTSPSGNGDGLLAVIPDTLPASVTLPSLGETFPEMTIGVAQSAQISVAGGTPPFTFVVKTGPPTAGYSVSADGIFSGTGIAVGTTTFTVEVTDDNDFRATGMFSHTINEAPSIAAATFPDWTVGIPFQQQLSAEGGTGGLVWDVKSGAVPGGMQLTTDGRILGTPSSPGEFTFTARVSDRVGATASRDFSMHVNAVPSIDAQTFPDWTESHPETMDFVARDGTLPLVWSIAAGTPPLPSFNASTGQMTGTARPTGSYDFTLRVTDLRGAFAERSFHQDLNKFPFILTSNLPVAAVGRAYSATLEAIEGTPPRRFAMESGIFGVGLDFDRDTGVVAGTPVSTVLNAITFAYTDAVGAVARRTLYFECAGAVDLTKKKAPDEYSVAVGGTLRTMRYLELTRGCLLSVVVTGGGAGTEGPGLGLRGTDGSDLDLGKYLKRSKKSATLKAFPIPETGRYFLDVSAIAGFSGRVKFTITIVPAAKFTSTVTVDAAAAPVEIPFAAPPGSKLTIVAKPAKKSAGVPVIAAIEGPGAADVLATGTVKTKGTTSTFTTTSLLAGGDHVLRLAAQPGTAGPVTYTITLKLPKTYGFDMADVPAGDGE